MTGSLTSNEYFVEKGMIRDRQIFRFLFYQYLHPVVVSFVITMKLFCSIKTQFMSCRKDIFVQLNDKNCQKKRQ